MPKKIEQEQEEEEYDEEDDFDEEEDEEEAPVQPPRRAVGRPAPGRPTKRQAPEPAEPAKRYAAFRQEALEGIRDVETNEVVAADIWTAFADMKDQLDRIENAIGVL